MNVKHFFVCVSVFFSSNFSHFRAFSLSISNSVPIDFVSMQMQSLCLVHLNSELFFTVVIVVLLVVAA